MNFLHGCNIYGVIQHHEYELQVSNIEEIKQPVAQLRQTNNTTFEGRDFALLCLLAFYVPQIQQRHYLVRWENKSPFDIILSQQCLCQ